ncbi:MAG: RNA polymerase sigma factor, partial [Planctomycetota bacterium]
MAAGTAALTETAREALGRFLAQRCGALLDRAWKILARIEDAEDAVQETAVKVAHAAHLIEDPARLPAFVLRTLQHECINRRRRLYWEAERRVPLPEGPEDASHD